MQERSKLLIGIAVAAASGLIAVRSFLHVTTPAGSPRGAPQAEEAAKSASNTSPAFQYLRTLRTEVQPTPETAGAILNDFEARVAGLLTDAAPTAPSPTQFASLARKILERNLVGDALTAPQAGATPVKPLFYMTPIGLEQIRISYLVDLHKVIVPDDSGLGRGFNRTVASKARGASALRDTLEDSAATVAEIRVPVQLLAPPQMTDHVIAGVGIRCAWDPQSKSWVFLSLVTVHDAYTGVVSLNYKDK